MLLAGGAGCKPGVPVLPEERAPMTPSKAPSPTSVWGDCSPRKDTCGRPHPEFGWPLAAPGSAAALLGPGTSSQNQYVFL